MKCPNNSCHYFSNINSDQYYTCGVKDTKQTGDITCPFCTEQGFDKPGLKSHFEHGDCEEYNIVYSIVRVM